jgi:hypothetical protein
LAFNVRVTGPEFASEDNRRAFLRIEESARQYVVHSRESIYFVRRPLEMLEDHFVLLSPRGAAIVGMYPIGGIIRGTEQGTWESEPLVTLSQPRRVSGRSREEHFSEPFANPFSALERARKELITLLRGAAERVPIGTVEGGGAIENHGPGRLGDGEPLRGMVEEVSFGNEQVALIALFTGRVEQLHITPIGNLLFSTMTIDDAVARSIVHTPNLLRAADILGTSYSNADLDRFSDLLEHAAQLRESGREFGGATNGNPVIAPTLPNKPRADLRRFSWQSKWLVPLLIVIAIVVFYAIRSFLRPGPAAVAPVPQSAAPHAPSEIVLRMPIEAELFISPIMFRTRQELDYALARGEGQRYLPDTEQVLVMDSVSLAKGVYGYFKVDNAWRKGKLLQTLQSADTVTIVKFLDPLP